MFSSKLLSQIDFIGHAFFGRHGGFSGSGSNGVSTGVYSSLNTSYKLEDNPKNVDKNREIIANKFDLPSNKLLSLKQFHSTKIIPVTSKQSFNETSIIEADGMITSQSGVILGVYTADCIPLLFVDTISKSIASVHCGWKGLLNGIIQSTIGEFKKLSSDNNIIMAIGPCIHQQSYEVDELFYENFIEKDNSAKNFFEKLEKNQKYSFNLPFYAYNIGVKNGIDKNNIDIINLNTYKHEDLFFSHRRSTQKGEKRGLQLSCITLKI